MKSDLFFALIGIVLMNLLPIFSSRFMHILNHPVIERKIIFYLTFFAVFLHIEMHGNDELLVGFLLGSSLCYLLVFEGMNRLFSSERLETAGREENYYFSFSVIITLLLSTDYLFQKNHGNNQLNRVDGILLLFLLFLFLVAEFRKAPVSDYLDVVKRSERKGKKLIYLLFLVLSTFFGSYFLVDGLIGLSMEFHIGFKLMGTLFLSWSVHFVNFFYSREKGVVLDLMKTAVPGTVFFFLLSFGSGAVFSPIHVTYETISGLIVVSIISVLLVWRNRVKNSIAGSVMLTMYIAGVVLIVVV